MIYKHQGEHSSFPKSFFFLRDLLSSFFAVKEADLGQGRAGSVRPGEGDGPGCAQSTEPQGWDVGAAKLLWCLVAKKCTENCVQSHQLGPVTAQHDSGISGAPPWRTLVSAL